MKINGRFLLLAVATGLFIRLWSNADGGRPRGTATTPPTHVVQSGGESTSPLKGPRAGGTNPASQPATIPHGEPTQSPPISTPTSRPAETATTRPVAPAPATVPSGTPLQPTEPGRVEDWTLERAPFKLPALSEGTWRVVDDTGRVALLNIPAGRGSGAGTAGEFLVHPVGGVRWYFIRLNSPQTASTPTPHPTPAPSEPGVALAPVPVAPSPAGPSSVVAQLLPDPFQPDQLLPEQAEPDQPRPPRVWTEAELAERDAVALDLQWAAEAAADEAIADAQLFADPADAIAATITATEPGAEPVDTDRADADVALLPGVAEEPQRPQPQAASESPVVDSAEIDATPAGALAIDALPAESTGTRPEGVAEPTATPQTATGLEPAIEDSAPANRADLPEPIGLERLGAERPAPVDLPDRF
ncbi:MAG: hypothetical protein ACKOJF_30800 [Planctomycetaceae bacterium]